MTQEATTHDTVPQPERSPSRLSDPAYRHRARSRALQFARGRWLSWRIGGSGGRLKVGRHVRLNRHHRDTSLELGRGVRLHDGVHLFLDADGARISIGPDTYLNRRTEIMCKRSVTIGARCAISWDVHILDTDYHSLDGAPSDAAIVIGDHVWIGCAATILKGSRIGDGAVVAAGALVTGDVPAGALVAGVPARIVREGVTWE